MNFLKPDKKTEKKSAKKSTRTQAKVDAKESKKTTDIIAKKAENATSQQLNGTKKKAPKPEKKVEKEDKKPRTLSYKRIKNANGNYREIRRKILNLNLDPEPLLTPLNIDGIRNDWLQRAENKRLDSPSFRYDANLARKYIAKEGEINSLLDELQKLIPFANNTGESLLWDYLRTRLLADDFVIDLAKAVLSGNDSASRDAIFSLYTRPSEEDIKSAYFQAGGIQDRGSMYKTEPTTKLSLEQRRILASQYFLASDIAQAIRDAINEYVDKYNLDGAWAVVVSDNTEVEYIPEEKTIKIPEFLRANGLKLARIIGKYVDGIWRIRLNAGRIGLAGTYDNSLFLGELEAIDHDLLYSYIGRNKAPLPYYTIAASEALEGKSFGSVAYTLDQLLPDDPNLTTDAVDWNEPKPDRLELIWKYTYGVFKGVNDPWNHQGYAFLKHTSNFVGYNEIKELKEKHLKPYLDFTTITAAEMRGLITATEKEDFAKNTIADLKTREKVIKHIIKTN